MTRSQPNLPALVDASSQIRLAEALASANLLPQQYQRNPANVLWAIQYADALGVHPMTAITGINVINGKPTASAQLIGGLVRRAGHKLRIESSDTKAVATIIRADDPDYTFRVEWTMDRARKAGLGGRGPWTSYPAAMLAARAITEVARLACPEALFGIIYTAEELGADVDEDGVVAAPVVATIAPPAIVIDDDPVEDPFIVDERAGLPADPELQAGEVTLGEPAARNQKTRIAILRKELGIDDEAYRKRLESLYGVTSAANLTTEQAADLIAKLTEAKTRREASDAAAS